MKTRSVLAPVIFAVMAAASLRLAAGWLPGSPRAAVHDFYTYHFAHDMAFTAEGVEQRAAWLAPDLLALCRIYFAHPPPPDEAPMIDGDPFTDSQEYPTSFEVHRERTVGPFARVSVTFVGPSFRRIVEVRLTRTGSSWLITDVARQGELSLRDLLEMAVR